MMFMLGEEGVLFGCFFQKSLLMCILISRFLLRPGEPRNGMYWLCVSGSILPPNKAVFKQKMEVPSVSQLSQSPVLVGHLMS